MDGFFNMQTRAYLIDEKIACGWGNTSPESIDMAKIQLEGLLKELKTWKNSIPEKYIEDKRYNISNDIIDTTYIAKEILN